MRQNCSKTFNLRLFTIFQFEKLLNRVLYGGKKKTPSACNKAKAQKKKIWKMKKRRTAQNNNQLIIDCCYVQMMIFRN
jgi:hypothetical protein